MQMSRRMGSGFLILTVFPLLFCSKNELNTVDKQAEEKVKLVDAVYVNVTDKTINPDRLKLRIDNAPDREIALLRFALNGVDLSDVATATLELYVSNRGHTPVVRPFHWPEDHEDLSVDHIPDQLALAAEDDVCNCASGERGIKPENWLAIDVIDLINPTGGTPDDTTADYLSFMVELKTDETDAIEFYSKASAPNERCRQPRLIIKW